MRVCHYFTDVVTRPCRSIRAGRPGGSGYPRILQAYEGRRSNPGGWLKTQKVPCVVCLFHIADIARELAKFDEKQRAVETPHPMRSRNEGKYRGRGTEDACDHGLSRELESKNDTWFYSWFKNKKMRNAIIRSITRSLASNIRPC